MPTKREKHLKPLRIQSLQSSEKDALEAENSIQPHQFSPFQSDDQIDTHLNHDAYALVQEVCSSPNVVLPGKTELSLSGIDTTLMPSIASPPSLSGIDTTLMPALPPASSLTDTATALLPSIPTGSPLEKRIAALDPPLRKQVAEYVKWLELNNNLPASPQRLQAYQDASLELKTVGKREVRTFAPFQERTSALRVITPAQVVVLLFVGICLAASFFLFHLVMLTLTIGVITALYICGFITSTILAFNSLSGRSGERIDEKIIQALDQVGVAWPSYTILCPLYKETAIVPQFVAAIKALDYPTEKMQVLFLTEENDKDTRTALYDMHLPSGFTILTVPTGSPQTKPRACNFGLLQAKGQFVVIFDAEDKPEPSQLKKAVLTFANHSSSVACVQAKLNYYNAGQNLLTRWFTAEYSTWFDIMLPGLQRIGFSLPLGGTSNHFRTDVLRALGGWDAFNVTEDCDLGLRIAQYGLQTMVLDSTTYEEATSRYKTWLFQRSRWIKGYMQTYLVHMRHPLQTLQRGYFRKFFSLQLIVGVWTFVLLINPIMWSLTIIYVLFRPLQLYALLFPGPILYMGTLCLIFGNFFYVYIHLLGCLRRKEASFLKWVLLLPLYWIMMSISAYIAFYQLIVKPHYWEKTQHGNHLVAATKAKEILSLSADMELEGRSVAASMPTARVLAIKILHNATAAIPPLESTTQRVTALRSTLSQQLGQRKTRWHLSLPPVDLWLVVSTVIALFTSITATVYALRHHEILLYSDAYFHLRIARRVIDSATPGIGQLGTTWVPLPHLLMLPFIWSNYLWQTGLAGSIPSMLCYLVTVVFLFLAAKRLTHDSRASFIGTLLFILNPNVLYLQTTPLSELVCIVTLTAAGYYFLAWLQDNGLKYMVCMAGCTCLATMARYDGWALFAALLVLVPLVSIIKRQRLRQIEGSLLIFLTLGSLAIILWLLYNQMLSGSPLYFLQGPFSSKVQTLDIHGQAAALYAYHNLWQSIRFYCLNSIETVGPMFFFLGLFALVVFLLRKRLSLDVLGLLIFFVPFGFYFLSLYTGQATLFVPGAVPASASLHNQFFNTRFGSETVVPLALCIATLCAGWQFPFWQKFWSGCGVCIMIAVILTQTLLVAAGGIITLEDGYYGVSCEATHPINLYLAQHYNGGRILEEVFSSPVDGAQANLDFKNIIWEGSYRIWPQALANPASMVDWIIVDPTDPNDLVAQHINVQSPQFLSHFTLVVQETSGLRLYHKKGLPPLPTKSIPAYIWTSYPACDAATG